MNATCPDQSSLAREFAERISKALRGDEVLAACRAAVPFEHKHLGDRIRRHLEEFLSDHSTPGVLEWEGRAGEGRRRISYRLLGTNTFPDMAVLEPFKCAIEFDREREIGTSHYKTCLMKAACHVLSGEYQACVHVYIRRVGRNAVRLYADKERPTQELLGLLRRHGLFSVVLPEA